jgi:hypothetical protein
VVIEWGRIGSSFESFVISNNVRVVVFVVVGDNDNFGQGHHGANKGKRSATTPQEAHGNNHGKSAPHDVTM